MKFLKSLCTLLACIALAFGFNACSNDDDPVYDAEKPYIGIWVIDEISNYRFSDNGVSLEIEAGQRERDFRDKWLNKTVKITKKSEIDGDKIWISHHSEGTSAPSEYYTIFSADESALELGYFCERYDHDRAYSRTTCRFILHRK